MHRRQYIPHSRPSTRLDRAIDAERKRKAVAAAAETAADAAAVRSRAKAIAAAAASKPPSAFRTFVDRVKRVANTPVRMPFGRRA